MRKIEKDRCYHKDCNEPLFPRTSYCIFHLQSDQKDIKELIKGIINKIERKDFCFKDYIFPIGMAFTHDGTSNGKPFIFESDTDFSGAQFGNNLVYPDDNFNRFIFNGCVFRGNVNFKNSRFNKTARFNSCQFLGEVDFTRASINEVTFQETDFFQNSVFCEAEFNQIHIIQCHFHYCLYFCDAQINNSAYFIKNIYENEADFRNVTFNGIADFRDSVFKDKSYFNTTVFLNDVKFYFSVFEDKAIFDSARFERKADFSNIEIWRKMRFFDTSFNSGVVFDNIRLGGLIYFTRVNFGNNTYFYFREPRVSPNSVNDLGAVFDNIRFNPHQSFIERVGCKSNDDDGDDWKRDLIMVFRNCQLKNVFFANNDMSLFSFYKSSFDEAIVSSSEWRSKADNILFFKYIRMNIIPEEILLDKHPVVASIYDLEDLKGYRDIATLYRSMKTALDRSKDYQEASWFYFNEMEMKRLAIIENVNENCFQLNNPQKRPILTAFQRIKLIFGRQSIYWSYKTFAGYGEKPLWSFYWFAFFSIILSGINLINGIEKVVSGEGGPPLHTIKFSQGVSGWSDIAAVFLYTISRVIPANYFGSRASEYYAIGNSGSLIAFVNAVILVVLVIFIGVGLKRHFRRF